MNNSTLGKTMMSNLKPYLPKLPMVKLIKSVGVVSVVLMLYGHCGCATRGTSAGVGAILGARVGGIIGSQSGHALEGAVIGTAIPGSAAHGRIKGESDYFTSRQSEIARRSARLSKPDQLGLHKGSSISTNQPETVGNASIKLWVDSAPSGAAVLIAPTRCGEFVPWKDREVELTTPACGLLPFSPGCWIKVHKAGFAEPSPLRIGIGSISPITLMFKLTPMGKESDE